MSPILRIALGIAAMVLGIIFLVAGVLAFLSQHRQSLEYGQLGLGVVLLVVGVIVLVFGLRKNRREKRAVEHHEPLP